MTTVMSAQDTISFGGIYDLPGAEVRSTYAPVSRLASQFTVEEVYRLPGTFYDPARLVALLPGVVQTNDQANHLSVRGNTPNANLWRLNGLAIVNPNHTANAGTFYDFPTLSGGGVNAISAQVLDNSGFFAGGLPVEYGNANGGTFDLRLRPGNKSRRRYQAQAGFIGFDLMAEGPIGSSKRTSYLINGRYSFTGLLADMGVDFGGEEIRFADINAHLHHRWEGGELSVFGIIGGSSNFFTPDQEKEITEQKELTVIDFDSDLTIAGANLTTSLGAGRLKAGLGYSVTNTERSQRLFQEDGPFLTNDLFDARLTGNLSYERTSEEHTFSLGAEVIYLGTDLESRVRTTTNSTIQLFGLTRAGAASPFLGYRREGNRSDLSLGLRTSVYFEDVNEVVFEPRLSYALRTGAGRITASAQRTSQIPNAAFAIEAYRFNRFVPVNNQVTLGFGRSFGNVRTVLRGYYQYTDQDYAIDQGGFLQSANNFLEVFPFQVPTETASTRRYGLELEAAGGKKTEGWYYRGSLSLLRAETEQADGEWSRDRFSVGYIAKATVGREWTGNDRKERSRTYGLNFALIANGGERYGFITAPPEDAGVVRQFFQPQDLRTGYVNQLTGYLRPDLRLYKTKIRAKTTTTLALDIQNVAGIPNTGSFYYDSFLEEPNERLQLGLIPVLSYRITWR